MKKGRGVGKGNKADRCPNKWEDECQRKRILGPSVPFAAKQTTLFYFVKVSAT